MTIQAIKQRFGIIGNSAALENALNTAVRVAPTDLTVLITGASGVGKEVFSKIIHELSARKHAQFIAVNCGAIPEGTINSELFGHEKGAFTGATEARKGYFETADGGTVFLDEIGEMPLDTQTHLLRILENGEFMRVGSSKVLKTNVRVIAATNVSLIENVEKRKFREDLYYRLSTVPIRVPALRDRKEDIYLLFRKFAIDFSEKYRSPSVQLDEEARTLLENYDFPGNIRQLKNIAEQISVLATQKVVDAQELLSFLPKEAFQNRALATHQTNEPLSEREILYKILFDLKRDMNDLKGWVYQLVKENDLQMPQNIPALAATNPASYAPAVYTPKSDFNSFETDNFKTDNFKTSNDRFDADFDPHFEDGFDSDFNKNRNRANPTQPIIINNPNTQNADYQTIIAKNSDKDDDLSMENMEKDMIRRALKKHKNRRREAADELGISERTLYRKIKQYDMDK
jgi:DNA-binding NtrC family response regulator